MLKNILIFVSALLLVVGCSKKKADDSLAGDGMDISERPLAFDPLGSDSGTIAGLNSINFDYDSNVLTADAKTKLAQNADWIRNNPGTMIQIEGHCDSRGSNEYNLTLGERRANTVKSYLQGLGIEEGRLSIISYGEEKLISMGDGESDHARNRRANFVPTK